MKIQSYRVIFWLLCCSSALLFLIGDQPLAFASEKWGGVDESVIERFAKEFGIEPKEPFINTDQGDLLLFVFLLAGSIGGFAAGYYWRALIDHKESRVISQREHKEIA